MSDMPYGKREELTAQSAEYSYSIFAHTADLGIELRSSTKGGLVPAAAEALYSVIGDLTPDGSQPGEQRFHLTGVAAEVLLRDFIAELLFIFESEHRYASAVTEFVLGETELQARAVLSQIDMAASVFNREVKAVTYHDLSLKLFEQQWVARLILDI
jgi:SHS2 domain-containing protein